MASILGVQCFLARAALGWSMSHLADVAEVSPQSVARFPLEHPRCGTAFLLTVVVFSIVVFALLGPLPLWERLVSRLLLLPVVAGVAFVLLGRAHVPLGRLPGDIIYRGKNSTFYFPLATSILVSLVLSVVLYLVGRFRQ